MIAVLASALERLALARTADDAEREHFQKRKQTEITEQTEILLPGGAFGENGERTFKNGFGLQQIVAGHGHQFMVGGEVVDEVDEIALEVIGVAKEYEFHCFTCFVD